MNAMTYNQKDHAHCPPKNSPCGNEGEHRCCLCLKPKELSNRRMYQLGYDEGRKISLDRAWEYVVKASREECGSKEDFIKFVNEEV